MAAPITVERFVRELEKLKSEMDSGALRHGEYDQRLSRVIGELREWGVDSDRTKLIAAIDDAYSRGVITVSVKDHLLKRIGLV